MRRLLGTVLLVGMLGLVLVGPVAANAPTVLPPLVEVFDDIDPCTGEVHTVTITVQITEHVHQGDRIVAQGKSTLTTTAGYIGSGTRTFVDNGQNVVFRLIDRLTDEDGNRIRVRIVTIFDLTSGELRVDRFGITCVGG